MPIEWKLPESRAQRKMEIAQLMFELSHPVRLQIFQLIATSPGRMTKIAESVRASTPEASRHLERLSAAGLVEKQADGPYRATRVGKLARSLLPGIDFVTCHWEYFSEHDLSLLPVPFLGRLGELQNSKRVEGIGPVIDMGLGIHSRSKELLLVMTPSPMPQTVPPQDTPEQVTWQLVVEPTFQPPSPLDAATRGKHFRMVPRLPAGMLMSEKEAGVCFRDRKGHIDPTVGFHSKDAQFLEWCKDIFNWCWSRGEYLR